MKRLALILFLSATAHAESRLETVRATKQLRWGIDPQGGAPYAFQDPVDPNHLIGFEVEIATALAHQLGVTAHPVAGPWAQLLPLLARGDFDIAMNGIEATTEKGRICTFTRAYYTAPQRLTVRRGDGRAPRTLEQLRGRRIGTLPSSLAEFLLRRAGAEVRTYDGGQDDIYRDLGLGRTDGVLLDEPATLYYGAIDPALEMLPGDFGEIRYAIAVPRGDEALKRVLDDALAELGKNGTLGAIYRRWGLWNPATATLIGDPEFHTPGVAESYETWRIAVGKVPPFWQRLVHRYPGFLLLFARGAALTLLVSLTAMALAIVLGALLALARTFGPRPLAWAANVYIEFIRGTPLVVQLIMIYFGLPEWGIELNPFTAGCLALGLNYASTEAENYRAGLASVPLGQHEAAATLGLSRLQTLRFVVAPQALRVAIPPVTNDFIALLKDSSLVALVTMTELNKTYMNLASSTRDHLGLGLIVSLYYLAIGLPFSQLARYAEARLGRHLRKGVR